MDPMLEMHRRDETEDFESACIVTDDGPTATWDGSKYTTVRKTIYSGPCTMRADTQGQRVVQAGDRPVSLSLYQLTLPYDVPVAIGQQVVVTASPDPLAVGRKLRITQVPKTDWLAQRTVIAEEEV
jgi:hypothetical protein